jgi:hypothetical protein
MTFAPLLHEVDSQRLNDESLVLDEGSVGGPVDAAGGARRDAHEPVGGDFLGAA